jgi:hypothetical protein
MKEERMKILDMVEKGIISADDANKLLYAITASDDEAKLASFARGVADFAKEVGEKTRDACVAISPKLKDATKIVVTKTAEVVDNISKSLNEAVKKMDCEPEGECDDDCCCGEEKDDDENKEN